MHSPAAPSHGTDSKEPRLLVAGAEGSPAEAPLLAGGQGRTVADLLGAMAFLRWLIVAAMLAVPVTIAVACLTEAR